MPQYFNNAQQSTAFSDGLMTGFNFIDSIQARRRALELEERAQSRADRGMALAENSDRRAQTAAEVGEQERMRDNEREDVIDARQTTLFEQGQDEFQRNRRVRDETEAARGALAESMFSASPPSLGAIGAAGATPRTRVPQATAPAVTNVRDNGQATDVPDSVQPTGPVDLRAAQRDVDNAPGFVDRIKNFGVATREGEKTRTAESFWGEVANPKSTVGTVHHNGIGHSVAMRDVRLDPAKYSEQYLQDRDRVPPEARASLDLTMSNALKEKSTQLAAQIAQLDPSDPKVRSLGNQLITTNNRMTTLAKAATSSAAADAGITRPVKVDDARVVPAITTAADRARQTQSILETTPDELRAASTMVSRMGGAKRLNQKQIAALTTLYAHGQIDAEQLNNWSKYGTPIAPKQATVHAIGNGTAIIMTPDGQMSFINTASSGTSGGMKDSEARLRQKENMSVMFNAIQGAVDNGDLEGDPKALFAAMLTTLGRTAAEIESKHGVPLVDPKDNAVRFQNISSTEAAELAQGFVQFHNHEVDTPWYRWKQGKGFTSYLPETLSPDEIIDMTSEFR